MWLAACPQSQQINFVKAHSLRGAAKYVSKYISKGVNTPDFTPELAARVVAGTYGTRWLFTSARIWIPFVPCCPACGQKIVRDIVSRWLATDVPDNTRWGPDDIGERDGPAQVPLGEVSATHECGRTRRG
jgi:hypothetical protein